MNPILIGAMAMGALSLMNDEVVVGAAIKPQHRLQFFAQKKSQLLQAFPRNLPTSHQTKVNQALNTWLAKIRAGAASHQASNAAIEHYKRLKTVGRSQAVITGFKHLGSLDTMVAAAMKAKPTTKGPKRSNTTSSSFLPGAAQEALEEEAALDALLQELLAAEAAESEVVSDEDQLFV